MKIAMFGHKRIPSREGGVEIVTEELSTRMVKAGHEVVCYNRSGHHVSGEEFDGGKETFYKGVRLKSVPTLDKKGLAAATASVFSALSSAFSRAQVVHIHAEGSAVMCWLPKLFGKKVIVTVHGLDWAREKWNHGFASKYIRLGEKMAVRFADEIIVLSRSVQAYFDTTYGRKTVYIPNGVTRPEIRPADEITNRWGLEKDGYILFLGRLVPEKGVHYLIEAFGQIQTDKRLVIAGGGSDAREYEQKLRELAGSDGRILFTGFVQGQALEELYSNAYVYVLPSDLEGMPLSLLEAMSYGNCCLVSDIPECTEVVEQYAEVFGKGDIADLARRLQALCGREDIVANRKERAGDFICAKYNWDDVTHRTLELYRESVR